MYPQLMLLFMLAASYESRLHVCHIILQFWGKSYQSFHCIGCVRVGFVLKRGFDPFRRKVYFHGFTGARLVDWSVHGDSIGIELPV